MGQVVPRRFFCGPCKKERWPGDCEHARVVSNLREMTLFSQQTLFDDVCRKCGESPRGCSCSFDARNMRRQTVVDATTARVFALVGCRCPHHVTAYTADKAKEAIACGPCCRDRSTAFLSQALAGTVKVADVAPGRIDNTGRSVISLEKVKEAIAFGLTDNPDRPIAYDTRMPGWVSNGHFMAHVVEQAYSALLREHKTYEAEGMFDRFKDWEAAGPGAQLYFEMAKCGTKDNPVDMAVWGVGYEWSVTEPNDTLSIVAPAYSNILTGIGGHTSVHRSPNQDGNGFSMLVCWDISTKKIIAAAMPRRETIIR